MSELKGRLVRLSSAVFLPKLFATSPHNALTTILYHKFFDPGETVEAGRTRLKRQLDWLCSRYTPLRCEEAITRIQNNSLPTLPLVITADDAKTDLLDVQDLFEERGVPLSVFACVGWIDNNEPLDHATPSRIAIFVNYYQGEELRLDFGAFGLKTLNEGNRDTFIDWLIDNVEEHGDAFVSCVWDVFRRHRPNSGPRRSCTWEELKALYNRGVDMGSHAVTHCPLAPRTAKRQAFELYESARVISNHFSSSPLFAYPYGSADVASDSTKTALIDSNYICGFLTHPGFAQNVSDVYCIPRIVIPKLGIGLAEFQARVTGGQIPFNTVSRLLGLR